MDGDIKEIIKRIDEILKNEGNESIDMLGSYIVGATIVRDDIDQYYEKYPLLEGIAELGADLETLGGTKYAEEVLTEIKDKFTQLKEEIKLKG